jgi:uncharacterized membrane protein
MHQPTDKELESTVARMLQVGVSLAAIMVFIGGALLLRHPELPVQNFSQFHPVASSLRSIQGITVAAFHFRPQAIVQFGLLLLITIPVIRVLFCVVGFMRQRDKLYTLVSSIVLVILLYSLAHGIR